MLKSIGCDRIIIDIIVDEIVVKMKVLLVDEFMSIYIAMHGGGSIIFVTFRWLPAESRK